MKCPKIGLLIAATAILHFGAGCATDSAKEDVPLDVMEAAADNSAPAATPGTGDTSEADLSGDTNPEGGKPAVQSPEPPAASNAQLTPETPPPTEEAKNDVSANDLDSPPQAPQQGNGAEAQATPTIPEPVPAPALEAPPDVPPPQTAEQAPIDNAGPSARVTALDFKANVNGGTVVLKTDKPVTYTTRKNDQTNQYIVELQNTTIPKKFRRPYTTKEFSGPIASINAYQSNGSARIVVQLREAVEPSIIQSGNIISVASQGGGSNPDQMAVKSVPASQDDGATESTADETSDTSTVAKDDAALQTSSGQDYVFGNNNKFYGRPISLELKDADIRDVFAFISEESGLNIVVGDDVTGKVTLKLRKIPWDQALTVLLQAKQLGYVRQGRILRISPLATLQKESDQAKLVLDAQRALQPLHVQVFPISYADVANIDQQVKDFLSTRGKSRGDKRTNNLVVTDIDENLNRIKALVKRLDTQTPQVLIEAKVIEARESFNRLVGVNWGFNGSPVDTNLSNNQGQAVQLTPNMQTQAPTGISFLQAGFSLGQLDIFGDITASLNLLETEGLAKVLSSPRIVTLDRQEADIKQTTQIPVFSSTTIPSATPGGAAVITSTVTYQGVDLELKVKPQITVDGSVIMDIDLMRQYADPVVTLGNSSAAPINTREAKTQVLVENGDTIVIGGIYQNDVTDTTTGVPWLSKIPFLGWLFKNNSVTRQKNELVMFLTPRILNREKAFDRSINIPGDEGTSGTGAPKASENTSTTTPGAG